MLRVGTNWEKRDRKMKKRNDLKEMNSLGLWEDRKQQQERDKEKSKRKKMYKKLEDELIDAFEND
jgi:hypothetical protein|tara:strand:- start:1808 stop:2002 length:195 start_codon:yes stop_codon:yes gene_type:complete